MLLCEVVHNRQCSQVITGSECCSVRWFHNRQCSRVITGSECCSVRWFHNRQCSRVITGFECCSVRWFIIDSVVGSSQALNAAL